MRRLGLAALGCLATACAAGSSPPPAVPQVQYANPADEQLVEVPATPAPQPAPTAAPAQPAQPAAVRPTLEVLAVAVRPPSVAPGGQVQLVINYEVGGLASGATVTLTEERQLVFGNSIITTLSDTVSRSAGPYTAAKPVTVPADAARGLYRLRARVYVGNVTSGATAVFEVR